MFEDKMSFDDIWEDEESRKREETENALIEQAKKITDEVEWVNIYKKLVSYEAKIKFAKEVIIDEEKRMNFAMNYLNSYEREAIISTVSDPTVKKRWMQNATSLGVIYELAGVWKEKEMQREMDQIYIQLHEGDLERQIEIFNETKFSWVKREVAVIFSSMESKKALKIIFPELVELLDGQELLEIIKEASLNDKENFVQDCINDKKVLEKIATANLDGYTIGSITSKLSDTVKMQFIKRIIEITDDTNILKVYLRNEQNEAILENLDEIMEIYGLALESIPFKKDLLIQMHRY